MAHMFVKLSMPVFMCIMLCYINQGMSLSGVQCGKIIPVLEQRLLWGYIGLVAATQTQLKCAVGSLECTCTLVLLCNLPPLNQTNCRMMIWFCVMSKPGSGATSAGPQSLLPPVWFHPSYLANLSLSPPEPWSSSYLQHKTSSGKTQCQGCTHLKYINT